MALVVSAGAAVVGMLLAVAFLPGHRQAHGEDRSSTEEDAVVPVH
jgi:Na+/H+-dicarboxylate symporter